MLIEIGTAFIDPDNVVGIDASLFKPDYSIVTLRLGGAATVPGTPREVHDRLFGSPRAEHSVPDDGAAARQTREDYTDRVEELYGRGDGAR